AELGALAVRDAQIAHLKIQTNSLPATEIAERIQRLRDATPDLPQAYILQEPSSPPPLTHVLLRGSPARPGDAVEPGVPAILAKQQPDFPSHDERTSRRRLG